MKLDVHMALSVTVAIPGWIVDRPTVAQVGTTGDAACAPPPGTMTAAVAAAPVRTALRAVRRNRLLRELIGGTPLVTGSRFQAAGVSTDVVKTPAAYPPAPVFAWTSLDQVPQRMTGKIGRDGRL